MRVCKKGKEGEEGGKRRDGVKTNIRGIYGEKLRTSLLAGMDVLIQTQI